MFRDKDCSILYSDKRTQQMKLVGVWGLCLQKTPLVMTAKGRQYDSCKFSWAQRLKMCRYRDRQRVEIDMRHCYTLTVIQMNDQCN